VEQTKSGSQVWPQRDIKNKGIPEKFAINADFVSFIPQFA